MIKPVSPNEITPLIPDFVINVVNRLLQKKWNGTSAIILQETIINEIINDQPNISREEIFDNGWLNFEDIYRKVGWDVEYDKPGYCESYKAYFKFTK